MNRIVLNFGDYILNEKRKETELFLSNRINENNEYGEFIPPIKFIKTRTYDKINYFFGKEKYIEQINQLDITSVIQDIVNFYESGGGEPGLTWDSVEKTLLVQEGIGSSVVKFTARFGGLLSRIRNTSIKENFKVLYKSVATSLKGGKYSIFLSENADAIINSVSGKSILSFTEGNAFGDIIVKTPYPNTLSMVQLVDLNKGEKAASDVLENLSKGYDSFLSELPLVKETIDDKIYDKLFLPYKRITPIDDVFKYTDKYQVIDLADVPWEKALSIININGEKKLFLGNIELDVDKSGNLFFMRNSFQNYEGKSIKNIDDYKKSFIDYFKKKVNPNEYNEKFAKRGAPSFNDIVKIEAEEMTKKVDEILKKEVGQPLIQSEEQLKGSDKKDYSLVKNLLANRGVKVGGVSVIGYAFWALWAREYYKQIGLKSDLYPAKYPIEFIKETNKRIQTLDSFNNLNKNWLSKISPFDFGNKFETIPDDVLPKISYYIAELMQIYYGKIIPTYLGALSIEEATK